MRLRVLAVVLALLPPVGASAQHRGIETGASTQERGTGASAQASGAPAGAEAWRDPERWRRLRLGMSRGEVLALLGEPGKVTRYYAFERWEYPDALGRRVNFDERGRLSIWGAVAR